MTKFSKTHPTKRKELVKTLAVKSIKKHPTVEIKIRVVDKENIEFTYFCKVCNLQRIQTFPAEWVLRSLAQKKPFISFKCPACMKVEYMVEVKYVLHEIDGWRKAHGLA